MTKEVTEEHLDKYFGITKEAMDKAKIASPEHTHLHKTAQDFLDMATRYYTDAQHFKEQGEWVRAFGALNYAHAWLDAGARLGVFDVDHDSRLFTVD